MYTFPIPPLQDHPYGPDTPARRTATSPVSAAPAPEVERSVLFGEDLRRNRPPVLPANARPVVSFRDARGWSFGMTEEMLSRHLLLLGSTGCGKTNVFYLLLDALLGRLNSRDVLFIFDTKGDFRERFYQPGNPAHILISNDVADRARSRSWNIFDELRDENGRFRREVYESAAREIGKQLFQGRESTNQPFFSLAASDLVAKVLIHQVRKAIKAGTENRLHTVDFVRFLQTARMPEYSAMIQDPDNPDFRSAQLYIGEAGQKLSNQALGVFGYITSMANDLFTGVFAERTQAGNFSMAGLVHGKGAKVVFVEYDLSLGETLGPMYRLLFDQALKHAMGGRSQARGNTYLAVDEFSIFPDGLLHITDALNFGRSLGVKVLAGLQTVSQLYDAYGPAKGKVLLSGFLNAFCFQAWDADSREYISGRFGSTYENLTFLSQTTPVTTQREGHTVSDWDILHLQVGEAFVGLHGCSPFRFRFPEYRRA